MHTLSLRVVGGTAVADGGETADAVLLIAAARGQHQAFAQLMRRHYQIVYRVVWRMLGGHVDAEDITQEAFMRLWRNPQQVREATALRGWLIRVASNLVNDRFRKGTTLSVDDALEVADDRRGAHESLQQRELSHQIDAAIAALPDRQRLAITLVQFEHMSNIAAAAIMEITVDALESLLARARKSLKQSLAGAWQEMQQ
jgi:RNA polymerase sigma-70 factor, ECF subfamily